MRDVKNYTILDAKGATGAGNAIFCQDYRNAIFLFATDGGGDAALTVKFAGAITDGATEGASPAFGSAQSVTNPWDYIQVIDLQNGTAINGDAGVPVASTDDVRQLEANINGLKYINAIVTARSAGEVTIRVMLFND